MTNDIESLKKGIANLKYCDGGTNTLKVLETLNNELENARKARPQSKNVLILLTDHEIDCGGSCI
jgi:hypothetical protein